MRNLFIANRKFALYNTERTSNEIKVFFTDFNR
jgi:hypothetical protein